jgi:hypothetical protein
MWMVVIRYLPRSLIGRIDCGEAARVRCYFSRPRLRRSCFAYALCLPRFFYGVLPYPAPPRIGRGKYYSNFTFVGSWQVLGRLGEMYGLEELDRAAVRIFVVLVILHTE